MKKFLVIPLLLVSLSVSCADRVALPPFGKKPLPTSLWRGGDKGLFGGPVGKGRMYFDIVLPPITPNLLIDVGMSMAQVHGVVGMAPRWFAMFSPTACPYSELYTAPKGNSAIMITYRVYF